MNIYKIGVAIALTNGMSPVLAIISRDLLGVHSKVKDIEKNFGRWALAVGGVAAVMGGSAIIGGLAKIAEKGSEVNHQLELMKTQGMQVTEVQLAAARAMQVTGTVLTTTYAENLQHVRELRYAFGSTADATHYLEAVAKANSVLNAVRGGGKDQVWELVKSLEQKGLTAKPDDFMKYVDQMMKAVVASGGKVTPAQFFSTFKYGRTAMLGWDETFVGQYLPRLIQSMAGGGSGGTGGPGNALMSAFAKIIQGQMTKTSAEEFARFGLGTAHHIKGSSSAQITGMPGAEVFLHNPYEWVQKFLMPALAKHGVTDDLGIIRTISRMFAVRTASQIIGEMALQGKFRMGDTSPFEKDATQAREAFDQRMSYDELIKNDYKTMMEAFHAQWKTFTEVVGAPLTEPGGPVVQALAHITSLLNKASQFAAQHPEGLKLALDVLAALAGSLVITGLIALGAAVAPLIGVGAILTGLAAGLAALAALNWDSISKFSGILRDHGIIPKEGGGGKFLGMTYKDSIWEMLFGKHWFDANPPAPGKQSFNAIPPSSGSGTIQISTAINLDGRKIAEAVTTHQVREGAGAAQGSPYHDSTYSTAPTDLALIG